MFNLVYKIPGMTCEYVEEMLSTERKWYLERLYAQLKKEEEKLQGI